MKILLISGHGAGDPGASTKLGVEADEAIYMVKKIKEALTGYATVTLYPTERNAYKDIQNKSLKVDFNDYDYVLEVHFNAAVGDIKGNGKTIGTEIYVTIAEKTVGVEYKILEQLSKQGLKNRGVKRKNYTVISKAKAAGTSSALLETCFIDDADDMKIYSEKKDEMCKGIANAIITQFKLKKTTVKDNTIKKGDTVCIKSGAVYGGLAKTRGKKVPDSVLKKKYQVQKVETHKNVKEALLGGINSWVAVKYLNK
ncbi:MAG: N-acetylmuramoyl-L-alanine amidase [Lachnospiraceae bacterium]|nr:N-acetylmuramoyl-L-alanine amidase [Lachnospiraceae bacterium]